MQLHTITELLGIQNYRVSQILDNTQERLELALEQVEYVPPVCSHCGCTHNSVHSTGTILVEDLSMGEKRLFLQVTKRKCCCPADGRIHVEKLAWLQDRFTKRFAKKVSNLTAITTNQEAGWFFGLDDEVVYRIDRKQLEEEAQKKLSPIPAPKYMSADEVAWQKWHHYVTNVVDIETRKVIWNHDGRGKGVLKSFYKSLEKAACDAIEAVALDGASGYISATKEYAKNALVVLDHFHVKSYLNDAVDKVRKAELSRARKTSNEELAAMLHCNKRFILMQNKPSKRKEDVLQKLAGLNEQIYKAMLLKEQFLEIYTHSNRAEAAQCLRQWIVTALKSKIPAFIELGLKFFRKRHFLLNYFLRKITTAISEGINNKIKRLKRMAYGYKDVTYFLLKIHQHCGLLSPRFST